MKLHEIEKMVILNRLNHFDGSRSKTASSLGMADRTLLARLKDYGVEARQKPSPESLADLTHKSAEFFSGEWFRDMLEPTSEHVARRACELLEPALSDAALQIVSRLNDIPEWADLDPLEQKRREREDILPFDRETAGTA